MELNNLVRNCLTSLRDAALGMRDASAATPDSGDSTAGRKASESGYISEEEKRPEDKKQKKDEKRLSDQNKETTPSHRATSSPQASGNLKPKDTHPERGEATSDHHHEVIQCVAILEHCDSDDIVNTPPMSLREEDCIIIESPDMFKDDVSVTAVAAKVVAADPKDPADDLLSPSSNTTKENLVELSGQSTCSAVSPVPVAAVPPPVPNSTTATNKILEEMGGGEAQVARTKSLLISLLGAAPTSSPLQQTTSANRAGHHQQRESFLHPQPDDPACPSHFQLEGMEEQGGGGGGDVEPHLLLLELAHRLLARQWKLVATTRVQESQVKVVVG